MPSNDQRISLEHVAKRDTHLLREMLHFSEFGRALGKHGTLYTSGFEMAK